MFAGTVNATTRPNRMRINESLKRSARLKMREQHASTNMQCK